jgi:hypothetical protein
VIPISFHASLRQYYRCTLMRCGVWNGVMAESFWRAQARIRALLFGRLGYVYSPTPECLWPFLMPPMSQPNSNPDISLHLHLRDHQFPVGCLAWSLDDTILLSSCEQLIKMWNVEVRHYLMHLEVSTVKLIPSRVPSSEPSMPIRRRSQHLLGYLMDQGSFQLPRIERSTYG